MMCSFKSAVSDIPVFHLAWSYYNTPYVLEIACPTIPGFYSFFCPAALCWAGSLEWPSQIVSAFALLYLSQRIHIVNAQSVCKTLTCHNQLFSRRKSKSQGREAGIWFASDSPLNCALAAPSPQGHIRHMCFGEQQDPGLILTAAAGSSHGHGVWPSWERVPAWLKGLHVALCLLPISVTKFHVLHSVCSSHVASSLAGELPRNTNGHWELSATLSKLTSLSETIWQALYVFANDFTPWKVFLPSSVCMVLMGLYLWQFYQAEMPQPLDFRCQVIVGRFFKGRSGICFY